MNTSVDAMMNQTQGPAGASGLEGLPPEQLEAAVLSRTTEELKKLEAALTGNFPEYKVCLREINKLLRSYPKMCQLITEEQIGVISQGLVKESDSDFFKSEKEAKPGSAKSEKAKLKELLSLNKEDLLGGL